MKCITINEKEARTILAVFEELARKPYDEINEYLGSLTIEEMLALRSKLNDWYQAEVNGKIYDDEFGWHDPNND